MLRNVWSKGDLCFRSGDILVIYIIITSFALERIVHIYFLMDMHFKVSDELGYMYFKDRKGDTFR